jgi:hypothetical protein
MGRRDIRAEPAAAADRGRDFGAREMASLPAAPAAEPERSTEGMMAQAGERASLVM